MYYLRHIIVCSWKIPIKNLHRILLYSVCHYSGLIKTVLRGATNSILFTISERNKGLYVVLLTILESKI